MEHVGPDGLYGFKLDTVDSLILSLLPPVDFEFNCTREDSLVDPDEDVKVFMLRLLVQGLRRCSGFHIPYVCDSQNIAVVLCVSVCVSMHIVCVHKYVCVSMSKSDK